MNVHGEKEHIDFIDLATQRLRLGPALEEHVVEVVRSGRYIMGPEVLELEEKLAKYVGVTHAITCADGTSALTMALMAHGIGAGDAVFCPSFTFAATAEAIALVGAEPVFVDIELASFNLSMDSLERAHRSVQSAGRLRPRAIIAVDLFGLPANFGAICRFARENTLLVVEDAAQSIGGHYEAQACGGLAHVGATSFYPSKPLGCYGDGGALFTDDDEIAERVRSIRYHGMGQTQYDNVRVGMTSRLDTIQAAILLEKLKIFEEEIVRRQEIASYYTARLENHVAVPLSPARGNSAWALYTVRSPYRDIIRTHLSRVGIPTAVYYARPLHQQPAYGPFGQDPAGLPNTESASSTVLSLPMHPYLTREQQDYVVGEIASCMDMVS